MCSNQSIGYRDGASFPKRTASDADDVDAGTTLPRVDAGPRYLDLKHLIYLRHAPRQRISPGRFVQRAWRPLRI
jgi:hypothetical protein